MNFIVFLKIVNKLIEVILLVIIVDNYRSDCYIVIFVIRFMEINFSN